MKLDETTLDIIRSLRDGRKPFCDIAQDLALSVNTVRGRVNQGLDEGLLSITGLVDPFKIPGHTLVFIGVVLRTPRLVAKATEFSLLRGVIAASVVTGRFDLLVLVLLNETFRLQDFFTQEVSHCLDGVQSCETFVVYHGCNLKVPYIL